MAAPGWMCRGATSPAITWFGASSPLRRSVPTPSAWRLAATIQFGDDLSGSIRDRALQQYIEAHPEKDLLAFVQVETANWLQRVVPEESDKFVVMAALNFVNCIAFVPLPAPMKPVHGTPCAQCTDVVAPR